MKKLYYYQAIAALAMFLGTALNTLAADAVNNLAKQQFITQAENFVSSQIDPNKSQQISINIMPIDKRIVIPNCPNAFTFSATTESLHQSNISVKAECAEKNWYMFIIVKVTEMQPVVVFAGAISPGTLLTENNVHIISMDKKRLRTTTFADIKDVVGARMKRRGTAGRPVEPNNLCFVCKGDSVTISAITTSMHIKTSGIALEDGSMGETISVQNSRSKKRVQAVVADTGQVQINI